MNLFYEEYPDTIIVDDVEISIITDFREYVRLIDMLKDDELNSSQKAYLVSQYFLKAPDNFAEAMSALTDFVIMKTEEEQETDAEQQEEKREVYSFEYDFPFIFSAFLSEYGINIKTIPYMHWWEFKLLFEGLSEDTEIKKRIMYRSINLSTIKDKDERERIKKIQAAIRLPQAKVSDYEIGNAFEW
jgi:hypothetical protein